jgi:hypothetical protein
VKVREHLEGNAADGSLGDLREQISRHAST